MKSVLKWLGVGLIVLVGLVVMLVAGIFLGSDSRINRTYDVNVAMIPIPTGAEAIAQGEHIALTRGCTDCHGSNMGGALILDEPMIARIFGPNLTTGQGGVGGSYTDEDYLRALRHGIGPDGRALLIMPSHEYYFLSDDDAGALIAYLKSVPAVDNQPIAQQVGPMARVLFLAGALPLVPAELIDHTGPRPVAPAVGVTVAYGEYLAVTCAGCHQADFSGGEVPGAPPGTVAANLTPGGALGNWSQADFATLLRTGVTPDGREVDRVWMPIGSTQHLTDDEVAALWLYMQSLPPVE